MFYIDDELEKFLINRNFSSVFECIFVIHQLGYTVKQSLDVALSIFGGDIRIDITNIESYVEWHFIDIINYLKIEINVEEPETSICIRDSDSLIANWNIVDKKLTLYFDVSLDYINYFNTDEGTVVGWACPLITKYLNPLLFEYKFVK